ncbi:helix-hairpin-helix domain-containing protein [Proteinivorax hydrogeniformans]|uniref:Helix-hairpin-helix domain-containing protein n=1 Tax=Proteinivorax hydrogeniformans TaxID=1826727 RepID=A0AAU8HWN6_9FIRM
MSFDKEKIIVTTVIIALVVTLGAVNWYRNHREEQQVNIESKEQLLEKQDDDVPVERIIVHVSGEVKKPGVYQLTEGDRVIDAIDKAGGATKEGDKNALNLAAFIYDGDKITIPKEGESPQIESESSSTGRININRATEQELQELNGIGASRAEAITQYREDNGPFSSPEDIKNVSGIGPAIFNQIKEDISVR